MKKTLETINTLKFLVKVLEPVDEPDNINSSIQHLSETISNLNSLSKEDFVLIVNRESGVDTRGRIDLENERVLHNAISFKASPDKLKLVVRKLCSWLDSNKQETLFAIEIEPAYIITLQTKLSETLVQILFLAETLLPTKKNYLDKVAAYLHVFGELTPASKENLNIFRHQLGLSLEEANDLDLRAMGQFKSLTEKYHHFRQELLICTKESDFDDKFWKVMLEKALIMGLPKKDVSFLWTERLNSIRDEEQQNQQRLEEKTNDKIRRRQEQQQFLESYYKMLEEIIRKFPLARTCPQDLTSLRNDLEKYFYEIDFNRGRLMHAREICQLSAEDAKDIEEAFIDEFCFHFD